MKEFVARVPFGEPKIFPEEYGNRVHEVGETDFFTEVFRGFSDSLLSTWMFWLAPYWRDIHYQTWRAILRALSGDRTHVYQFVRIAREFLALDVLKMTTSDPDLREVAREITSYPYSETPPTAGSVWFQEMCDEFGIDNRAIWARLAKEGAPMNLDGG